MALVGCLALWAGLAPAALADDSATALEAPRRTGLVIDGNLGDWQGHPSGATLTLREAEQALEARRDRWRGPEDASAKVMLAIDGGRLLLAARIDDDLPLHDPTAPWWHGDSLELFLDVDRAWGRTPGEEYTDNCLQMFLMPRNPTLAWGVVYRGLRARFDDAGLRGVQLEARERSDGYDMEVAIPLANFDLPEGRPFTLGFAVALNDADLAPADPGTYLTSNGKFDLYRLPANFGTLRVPALEPQTALSTSPRGPSPLWVWLALGLGLLFALALAGPGARWLETLGARAKVVALACVGLIALGLYLEASWRVGRATADVRARLDRLAGEAAAVFEDARAAGALASGSAATRAERFERLLEGASIPANLGTEATAFVPLHPGGAFDDGRPKRWRLDLGRAQTLPFPQPVTSARLRLEVELEQSDRARRRVTDLGTLTLTDAEGGDAVLEVRADDADRSGTSVLELALPDARAWTQATWSPAPATGTPLLRALAMQADEGGWQTVPLPGWTRERVPVLAHPGGPDLRRKLAPETSLRLPLPELLGGADRLWLLMSSERAFPDLLGDAGLVKVVVHYAVGDPEILLLRNGRHLSAERVAAGIPRPSQRARRTAWSWRDSVGTTFAQDAIPIRLETTRRPIALGLENLGPGGAAYLVAATVVRTRRIPDGSSVRAVADADGAFDRVHLHDRPERFEGVLRATRPGDLVVTRTLGEDADAPTTLRLRATSPEASDGTTTATGYGLLVCLALGLFLLVLLAVDLTNQFTRLSKRLTVSVVVAALIPLVITLFVVDRSNVQRLTSEYTERVQRGRVALERRLDDALRRARRAARRLATHLATGDEAPGPAEIERLARLYGGPALLEGTGGSALITGARIAPRQVALGPAGDTLRGTRFLPVEGTGGYHASPWDGLVLLATARQGGVDRWARVNLGLKARADFLRPLLGGALAEAGAAAVITDAEGRPLVRAGSSDEALARAVEHAAERGWLDGPESGPRFEEHLGHDDAGQDWLAVAAPLRGGTGDAPSGPWLTLAFDRSVIADALREQRQILLGLALFGLALIMAVASLLARRVARPVRDLVAVTGAVQRGEFDVEVPSAGQDEVGDLAVSFDQMRRALKHRLADLDLLRTAQDRFAATLDLGALAQDVTTRFLEVGKASGALLLTSEGRGSDVLVRTRAGDAPETEPRPFRPSAGGWILPALTTRGAQMRRRTDHAARIEAESGMGRRLLGAWPAWIEVPLRAGRELQGLLVLGYDDAEAVPGEEARAILGPLAGVAASALHNARLYRLAALDEATGLPGTTAFEGALRRDVEAALSGGPAAVLLRVGLDHGEHVTKRQGVEASRRLLRASADAMRGLVGDRTRLGRLRGDELAVRMPGAALTEARELAEAIRERIAAIELPPGEGGDPLGTTVSIGVARAPEDAGSAEFLLDAAGRALAAARREGGNHVEDVARVDAGSVDMPPFEEGAIFRNERMVRVVEAARRAARSDASVLVTGETGTGKEVIATLIHRRSARSERPFVSVNCAAFPETLLESELFGHERGAFTGAERRREGRFELADGGTLFLDEIAEMSPSAQVKLLRVLQERQFTRLGGVRTITVDVRIVAATNKDLEAAVADGSFREDLYYRLNVIRLALPPLRDRREEIPHFVERFLSDFRRRAGRGPQGMTPAAMDVLYRHPWPGNVRELKNAVERCAVLCEADWIEPQHLQLDGGSTGTPSTIQGRSAPGDDLNARQRQLLAYLARNGRATNRVYTEMTGTSPRTALRDLQDLMSRGLIVREGKRRGAVYRLP